MSKVGELELIRESLISVVGEMRANIIYASYSSIIYEGHDFSCGLLDKHGNLIAQSLDDNPIHIFCVPFSARAVLEKYRDSISEGDVFLHNDPYSGGTHLNDILMLTPVFFEGELSLFVAIRCHWGDVGGMLPGSLSGRATEIFQEGIRIAPIRICSKGVMNEEILQLLFNNMRTESERKGDFNTMLGASRKAEEHTKRLLARFGLRTMLDGTQTLIERSEQVMRDKIAACPNKGKFYAEGYVESNGHVAEPLIAKLCLEITDNSIIVDFWEASPQTDGPTNVGPAMAINSSGTIIKAFLDPHSPMNHGTFKPIEVRAPRGTFINAVPPVPCGGSVEVKAMLDALVAFAMGQAMPDKKVGDLKGGGNHIYISGPQSKSNETFLYYEYPAGGTGATNSNDGNNACRAYTEGDFNSIQSVEVIESMFPLRVECNEIREGCCGDGEYRSGFGLRRDLRILCEDAKLSVLSDKNVIPPYGVAGGKSGYPNAFTVLRDGETVTTSPVPGKVSGFALKANDVVRIETAGGGGFGDPLDRDYALIEKDCERGYLSREQAKARYGAILTNDGVDQEASEALRRTIREARMFAPLAVVDDQYSGVRKRMFRFSERMLAGNSLKPGQLIELVSGDGIPVRGWTAINPSCDGTIGVDSDMLTLFHGEAGSQVEIREIRYGA
ncbi:MAG: hydantoinase B/oxoprolinase family protein [Rhizobiaceae bacterium]